MGYRSHVVLAISKELVPHFMVRLSQNKEAESLVFNHCDDFRRDYGGDGSWLMVWNEIKWYEGLPDYEDISCLSSFIEQACDCNIELGDDESESDEHIRFIRVGEETVDIAVMGSGFDDIYANTVIEY